MIHIEAYAVRGAPKVAVIFLTVMLIDREICLFLQNLDFLYVIDSEELQRVEAIVVA